MTELAGRAEEPEEIPPWLRVGVKDVEGLDFETPIAGATAADCGELADLYRSAAQAAAAEGGTNNPRESARLGPALGRDRHAL